MIERRKGRGGMIEAIERFVPKCEQEERDRELMLHFLRTNPDAYLRSNTMAHMTASSWVISPDGKHIVMVYHNIYQSWAWTGGHADGDHDLLAVAIREAQEETGLEHLRPVGDGILSLECLTVDGHVKRGKYVSSHLHLNVTYLLRAEETAVRRKSDENSAVGWFTPEEALAASSEPWMVEHVYRKLVERARAYME